MPYLKDADEFILGDIPDVILSFNLKETKPKKIINIFNNKHQKHFNSLYLDKTNNKIISKHNKVKVIKGKSDNDLIIEIWT